MPPPEPPEGWETARPVQGEPAAAPQARAASLLPAPTEDTATAKARLDEAMANHMIGGMRLHRLCREIRRKADEEIAFLNDKLGLDQELSPGECGAITT